MSKRALGYRHADCGCRTSPGHHVPGAVFYEGEAPDRELFGNQAEELGFDVDAYLAALDRVPVFSREKVQTILEYDKALVSLIADLHFLERVDRVNQAIQGTNDLEKMMSHVLEIMLSIFDCDRAWLVYPCGPEAASWQVPMERTRPEYPGALEMGLDVPMDPDVVKVFQTMGTSSGPVTFGPGPDLDKLNDLGKFQDIYKKYLKEISQNDRDTK